MNKLRSLASEVHGDDVRPLVTVVTLTYNHEAFISETIDGILMQKVDFPVEIVIHDDASTDGTGDVIRSYAERFPDRFITVIQEENLWSKKGRVIDAVFHLVRGKYISHCEGDDYWTDPLKLKTQVDMMESDRSLCGSFHRVGWLDQKSQKMIDRNELPQFPVRKRYTLDDLLEFGCIPHTNAAMLRTTVLERYAKMDLGKCAGDYAHCLLAATTGDFGFVNRKMSVYRAHDGGAWSASDRLSKVRWAIDGRRHIAVELSLKRRLSYRRGMSRLYAQYSDQLRHQGKLFRGLIVLLFAIVAAPFRFRVMLVRVYLARVLGRSAGSVGWNMP